MYKTKIYIIVTINLIYEIVNIRNQPENKQYSLLMKEIKPNQFQWICKKKKKNTFYKYSQYKYRYFFFKKTYSEYVFEYFTEKKNIRVRIRDTLRLKYIHKDFFLSGYTIPWYGNCPFFFFF